MSWDLDFQGGRGINSGTKRGWGKREREGGNVMFSLRLEELLGDIKG